MPIYTVEGPDGRVYEIEGPENAREEDIIAFLTQQAQPPSADVLAAGSRHQQDSRRAQMEALQREVVENNPTRGMTGGERFRAGMGKAFSDTYLGLQQIGGNIADAVLPGDPGYSEQVQKQIDQARQLDRPLMQTGAGFMGNITGAAAEVVGPGAFAKAAGAPAWAQRALMPGSRGGQVAQGTAFGAIQPVATEDGPHGRLANAALGAGGAYVGSKLADGISSLARPNTPIIDPQRAAAVAQARGAGYVLPPTEIRPSMLNEIVEGVSGKIKTAQAASTKNQQVTNKLAKQALGMTDDVPLTRDTLQAIRQQAGQAYDAVGSVGQLQADTTYKATLKHIAGKYERAGAAFPKAVKSRVTELMQSLDEDAFDAAGAIDMVRILRDQADTAFRQGESGMGKAAKDASKALEDLVERNLQKSGQPGLLKTFREARQTIAKTYTVERALNDQTGDVSAKALAALLKKGKPLTGDLKTIAQTGEAFPKATQALTEPYRSFSPLDFWTGALGTGATGNPVAMGAVALRPGVRSAALSEPFQRLATAKALTGRSMVPRVLPLPYASTNRVLRRIAAPGVAGGLLGVGE